MENIVEETLSDAQAQIIPQLTWVAAAGGPEIRCNNRDYGTVEIAGLDFGWLIYSGCGTGNRELTHHYKSECHQGWITVSAAGDGGVHWKRVKLLAQRELSAGKLDLLTAQANGKCSSLIEAIDQAMGWDFEKHECGGYEWHKSGDDAWRAEKWGDKLDVGKASFETGDNLNWIWRRRPEKLESLLKAVGGYELSGWSKTREEAMLDASQAVNKVIEQCLALASACDQFSSGKAAGRAELASQINRLIEGETKND